MSGADHDHPADQPDEPPGRSQAAGPGRAVVPGTHAPLAEGELVMLIDRKGRRYLRRLEAGEAFHTHAGYLSYDRVIGGAEGAAHRTSENMELTVLRPTRGDYVLNMPRGAQVIYPKDQARILDAADIRPGCTVVEAGAGSGALSLALLAAVGPGGRLVSYERRDDHLEVARDNVIRWWGGVPDTWELRARDVAEDLAELAPHRVVLDLTEPWTLVEAAGRALAPGGLLLAYVPTVPQVMRFTQALRDDGRFGDLVTSETLTRGWQVEGLAVRPEHRMVAHTGFVTTARRVLAREEGGPGRPRGLRGGPGVLWVDDDET